MALHVFIAMPFGMKEGIDFDKVYETYIRPALEGEGYEVFRADDEMTAGNIRTDMFQELLLADLVLADLTLDNPNVWYELGVRHALRARGVIQIASTDRAKMAFDVYTDRTLRYHLKEGGPDPEHLDEDRKSLGRMARATLEAWHGYKVSPVYHLLPALEETNWKNLIVKGSNEFLDSYKQWSRKVEVARQLNRPGDILVLAEETPTWVLRMEARRQAGKALMKLGQLSLALEQFESALVIDPNDLDCNQQKGILLGRLRKYAKAREHVKALVEQHPHDPEIWALLGRVEKDEWVGRWRRPGATPDEMRKRAATDESVLVDALEPYMNAFIQDPGHYYSGVNAVTLRHLHLHLGGELKNPASLRNLEGGVIWSCMSAMEKQPKDYWARVSFADMNLLLSDRDTVVQEYRNAVAAADHNWFALDSTRQQILILRDLGFRPEQVAAALDVLEEEIALTEPPWKPRQVLLFSGHMIDKAGRGEPRFPAEKESVAAAAIAAKLDELCAGPDDLALCGGACGGDILFAEACLSRGLKLQIHIQFDEPEFLQASVNFAGQKWTDRYYALKAHLNANVLTLPDELGPLPKGVNPYVRNNLWQLYTSLSHGPEKVRFISLWDGKAGDGPGGTKHMVETVRKYAGRVYILDTNELFKDTQGGVS